MSGSVLWEGPSPVNGVPLVVIATMRSENAKTGPMVQTWILVRDVRPAQVIQSSILEAAICGNCPHRSPRRCYVAVHQAPTVVWDSMRRGLYRPGISAELEYAIRLDGIRLGSYGDPGMVPIEVWERVTAFGTHTGYTHMWRELDERWQRLVMASCETTSQVLEAQALGWSTYRVSGDSVAPLEIERQCPENLTRITCRACGKCDGRKRAQRHIWAEIL